MSLINESWYTSNTQEWATPQKVFDELDAEFHFTLDPCCTHENAKCEKHYTIEDDGLTKSWGGEIVFCNPPYNDLKRWAKKCYEEFQQGTTVVMLVPARTDTQWFHRWIYHKAELRFIEGRLRFGGSSSNAPFPSMVVVFDVKQKVRQAILDVLERKKRDGEVLPYATSIEVAKLLEISVREVEMVAKGLEGIERSRTINCECYYE